MQNGLPTTTPHQLLPPGPRAGLAPAVQLPPRVLRAGEAPPQPRAVRELAGGWEQLPPVPLAPLGHLPLQLQHRLQLLPRPAKQPPPPARRVPPLLPPHLPPPPSPPPMMYPSPLICGGW